MIEEDIAKDNLRSCSQQTHYIFDWTQTISNHTPPPQIHQKKKTFTKISAQIKSDFQSLKNKFKTNSLQKVCASEEIAYQMKKLIKEKPKQKKQQILCRFEYPVIEQTDQTQFWTKIKQEAFNNKKLQSFTKRSSCKKLTDLVEQQINKLNIGKSLEKQSNKISPFGLKQNILVTTNTLPAIIKRKIHPFIQQYETRPILIDVSQRQESAIKRRSSMPIIKHKHKF